MKSWKTTLAGVAALLTSLGIAIKAFTVGDFATVAASVSGIATGIGLLFARDNNVSSEDAGIK